jgi:DNA-directed RNA polymerase specialized sigma24 family protein
MLTHDEGYNLFRRAIVDRVPDAWIDIVDQFRPLLISWAHISKASTGSCEQPCDIADEALARAWVALTPDRFAAFPSLPALLAYLKACVTATAIDHTRSHAKYERLAQKLTFGASATPDDIVLYEFAHAEYWHLIESHVRTAQEHVILTENIIHEIPPRVILRRYPELFTSIAAVYRAKRNLFDRLRRNPDVQRLLEDNSCTTYASI